MSINYYNLNARLKTQIHKLNSQLCSICDNLKKNTAVLDNVCV